MNTIAAIAFDLDGTLVDSAGGIAHALNAALADAGMAPFDLRTVRAWIGDGPDALIERALSAGSPGAAGSVDSADGPALPALVSRLRRGFDAATLTAPMAGSAVFDGITDLLGALRGRWPLAVVTNKPTPLARAVLAAAGLLPHFTGVHGADTPAQRKPSPRLITEAAAALGVATHRLLMVGDAPVDLEAARAAGCRAAWAGWGYGQPASPHDAGVQRLDVPQDLLALLDRLAGQVAPHTGTSRGAARER